MSEGKSPVIVLVHGTWPYGPPVFGWFNRDKTKIWTASTSTLSRSVLSALGEGALIHPFYWSGRNSPVARRRAGDKLASTLRNSIQKNSGLDYVLIGHSHGGAVILNALGDEEVRRHVCGVACLSTPFLHVRRRFATFRGEEFIPAGVAFLLFAIMAFLIPGFDPQRNAVHIYGSYAAVALVVGVMVLIRNAARRLAAGFEFSLTDADLRRLRLLIVRSTGDEASAGLAMAQFLSSTVGYIASALATFSARPWNRLEDLFAGIHWPWWYWLIYCTVAVLVLSLLEALAGEMVVRLAAALFLLPLAVVILLGAMVSASMVLAIATIAVSIPFLAVAALVMLPFGSEAVLMGILHQVSVEASPPGAWTVHQVRAPEEPAPFAVVALHSASYRDPEALAILETWLRDLRDSDQ